MACYQEEIIQAAVRHLSSVNREIDSYSYTNVSPDYLGNTRSFDEERRAFQDIKDAAIVAYLEFCASPAMFKQPTDVRNVFQAVNKVFNQWRSGISSLADLVKSMNDTLAKHVMQSEVELAQAFISVHNIFSLLQLKDLHLQALRATQST